MSKEEGNILASLKQIKFSRLRDTERTFSDAEKDVAQKAMAYIEKNWEDIEAKRQASETSIGHRYRKGSAVNSYVGDILQVLSENPDIAERAFALAKRSGLGSDYLYFAIANNNPSNADIHYKILKERYSESFLHSVNNREEFDDRKPKCDTLSFIIENNSNNEKVARLALTSIEKTIQENHDELKYWDSEDTKRKELDEYFQYFPEKPAFEPRKYMIELASHNIEFPELVERCLEQSADFPNYLQDSLYNALLSAGYKANNFEDRYAKRLNNKEFDFQKHRIADFALHYYVHFPFNAIADISDKLDTKVLRRMTEKVNIAYENALANKWPHESSATARDYDIRMENVVNKRIKEEAIAKAKVQENPPAVIFIEEFVGGDFGTWAERAYIKDAKGEYLETDIVDDYGSGEDSSARDQLGKLVTAQGVIYRWDEKTSDYQLLEAKEGVQYRVLSDTAYWRDEQTSDFYHQGANEGSVLVSQNPVNGEFEDVPYDNIERNHGDYVEGAKKSNDGSWKKVIYKRNEQDGNFYPEVEFPYGECISCFQGSKDEISISFIADNNSGTYTYKANKKYSTLTKTEKDKEQIIYCSDPIQLKADTLREKLGNKLGKTDKYSTEEAKTHIDTAKQVIQMKHPKRGGIGE